MEKYNTKWVILRLLNNMLYRIEFDGEDCASAFVKEAYVIGKVNLFEWENHIMKKGLVMY